MTCARGSSPLARGLHAEHALIIDVRRIIPARAGFTTFSVLNNGYLRDHPRSRGVYVRFEGGPPADGGSSPLARGLLCGPPSLLRSGGIIPARAGFTHRRWACGAPHTDHPRSRGVYAYSYKLSVTSDGSSPLARGLPYADRRTAGTLGIIPARAGFTRDMVAMTGDDKGSSPLARGLPLLGELLAEERGIIPARAGFTASGRQEGVGQPDHPRSRGVYPARNWINI